MVKCEILSSSQLLKVAEALREFVTSGVASCLLLDVTNRQ